MKYKAIALDMDGTLLNTEHKLTTKTRDALLQAQEAGVKVILASGRPDFGMMTVAKELRLKDYGGIVSSFNGGKVIDMQSNEVINENALTIKDCHELYDFSRICQIGLMTYNENSIITEDCDKYTKLEFQSCEIPFKKVDNFKESVANAPIKCLGTGDPEHIIEAAKKFQTKFNDRFSIFSSMPFFLEMTKKGVNKGVSLEQIAKYLNINLTEIIACGDGNNDLEMIKRAGLGVAMDNANDTIKAAADYITTSNNDEGVTKIVNEFILN